MRHLNCKIEIGDKWPAHTNTRSSDRPTTHDPVSSFHQTYCSNLICRLCVPWGPWLHEKC